ncbi:hypothetical protein WR25_19189 isoform F [Diploscapter pachys]|uniref:Uncharacterized protein n=1 Tax=Diploscapter pachys TaxID=2018661 RepID=A0A2A2JF87_9BILA|nr:hypothetical protein WR25_19189 isoform A [Diploscapter pachys]PAV60313.1 hypothetical protein WR25_19189 isoform B [Diploscapter pachys]PAV60314.1 hypothetical protein WR25_19189 isoform C [Diploscapter pachys]PAV60315.1 hypothetical protein WR25_19189 isoform D [Diploscapter pachys]PAV60316.1 hypothetical protein WR25_19189 isoform E [Diploscapter pachys]
MKAAEAAGLTVLRLLNEPTAAALAYSQNVDIKDKTILVYDLGGGGEDFDQCLMQHLMDKFEKDKEAKIKGKSLRRLRKQVMEAKENLSFTTKNVRVDVDNAGGGEDLNYPLTREIVTEICGEMFKGTMYYVDKALGEAKMTIDDIDEVLLVGGSTRLPQIHQLLETKFGSNKISQRVKPDEAVALGAACLAFKLENKESEKGKEKTSARSSRESVESEINEVTSLSIGCGLRGDLFQPLIPRGTKYPCKASTIVHTTGDNVTNPLIPVFEGERAKASLNLRLGQTVLTIDPAPRGQELRARLEKLFIFFLFESLVDFKIDKNGLLHATFTEVSTGKSAKIKISYDSESKATMDIHKIIENAKKFENEDNQFRLLTDQRTKIEDEAYDIKRTLENFQKCMIPEIYTFEMKQIDEYLDWLDNNLLNFECHPKCHLAFKCNMLRRMRE